MPLTPCVFSQVRFTVACDVHYPFLLPPYALLDEGRAIIDLEAKNGKGVAVHDFGPHEGRRLWSFHFFGRSLEALAWKGVRQNLDDAGGGNVRSSQSSECVHAFTSPLCPRHDMFLLAPSVAHRCRHERPRRLCVESHRGCARDDGVGTWKGIHAYTALWAEGWRGIGEVRACFYRYQPLVNQGRPQVYWAHCVVYCSTARTRIIARKDGTTGRYGRGPGAS